MVLDRVLIVDDERLIRWSMKECLETAGYEAEAAESGKAALEALNQSPFDIVLLDYKLPDVNGLELLEKIKTSHVDIPVVMITAHFQSGTCCRGHSGWRGGLCCQSISK